MKDTKELENVKVKVFYEESKELYCEDFGQVEKIYVDKNEFFIEYTRGFFKYREHFERDEYFMVVEPKE